MIATQARITGKLNDVKTNYPVGCLALVAQGLSVATVLTYVFVYMVRSLWHPYAIARTTSAVADDCMLALLGSFLIAVFGLIFDKSKLLAIVAIILSIPALCVVAMFSGYW